MPDQEPCARKIHMYKYKAAQRKMAELKRG